MASFFGVPGGVLTDSSYCASPTDFSQVYSPTNKVVKYGVEFWALSEHSEVSKRSLTWTGSPSGNGQLLDIER
jgi:hypothetical protein